MKKFLIPVDFSDTSAHTFKFALEFNKHFFAHLDLIHIFDVPFAIADEEGQLLTSYDSYIKNYEDELWDFVKEFREEHHADINVHASTGGYYEGIMGFARNAASDMIIVGNRGKGNKKKLSFGSVAKYLFTHPEIPVLAIPEDFEKTSFKKILLAIDLSSEFPGEHAQFLRNFAEQLGASLNIIHIKKEDEPELPETEKYITGIEKLFGKKTEMLIRKKGEHINEIIHDYNKQNNTDLLVTIPHSHSWLDLLFIGSETRNLFASESIPVLSLRDPRAANGKDE